MSDEGEQQSMSGSDHEVLAEDAIFVRSNEPILIYLHSSLGRGGRHALVEKIKAAGGDPGCEEREAEVIICREDQPIFKQLEFKYDHHRYIWVEGPSWVDWCIRRRKYGHFSPLGKRTGAKRGASVPFTKEDDRHLVEFLALRIPYKDMGGRNGHGVYKDLCNRLDLYPWAKRHPWQSWRERYKKNQGTFDPCIRRAVRNDPDKPKPGGKGQYTIPRKPKLAHLRHTVQYDDDDDDMEEIEMPQEIEEEEEELSDDQENVSYKRSRPESDIEHRHRVQEGSESPPRKQQRHQKRVLSEDEDEGANFINDNVEPRQESMEFDHNIPPPDDDYFNPHPGGPSQFEYPPELEQEFSVPSADASKPEEAHARHRPATPNPKPSKAPASRKENMAPPPPPPRGAATHVYPQPEESSSKIPADSQRTVVGRSQAQRGPLTAPPDTQATLVPSSPQVPEPPSPVRRRPQASPPRVYKNTRSRARSASVEPAPAAPVVTRRGRKKAQAPQPPSRASMSAVEEESQQDSLAQANATLRDEVRVEQLLKPDDDSQPENARGDVSSDQGSSESESDKDIKHFLTAHKTEIGLIESVTSSGPKGSRFAVSTPAPARSLPHVNLAQAGLPRSRKTSAFRPTRESDPDVTPKPKPPLKAAKKVATRNAPVNAGDEDTDVQSETAETTTTESSFPAEVTDARQYKTAQSPFTPALGTRAERHVRSTRTTKAKGKARAQ